MKDQKGLGNPAAIAVAGAKAASWTKRNWKPIAYTGAGLLAVYGVYKVYKLAFPGGLQIDPKLEPTKLNTSQAAVIADRLFDAMRYQGTNESAIFEALRNLNHNDFVKVSSAFGLRPYVSLVGIAPEFDWMGKDTSLVGWLTSELDTSEINQLRQILPEIF